MKKLTNLAKFKASTVALEPYEHTELPEELYNVPTIELLEKLDKILQISKPDEDRKNTDYRAAEKIQAVLACRLEYPIQRYYSEDLVESLNTIIEQGNVFLEVFKDHRHDKDKNYTEKPIW